MVFLSSFEASDDVVTFDGLGSFKSSVIPLESDWTSTLPRCPLEAGDVVSTPSRSLGSLLTQSSVPKRDVEQCFTGNAPRTQRWQRLVRNSGLAADEAAVWLPRATLLAAATLEVALLTSRQQIRRP